EYEFTEPGTYDVTLTVKDDAGNTDSDTITVTVNDVTDPVADAGKNITVGIDEQFTLDGSGSSDNGKIVKYIWTIQGTDYQGEMIEHSFSPVSTYEITLTVKDEAGNTDTDSITITVEDQTAPTADARGDSTVDEDTVVTFNGSGSSDNVGIVEYTWTINGETKNGEEVKYTFTNPGEYDITLNVTDEAGNWDTDTITVTVLDVTAPSAVIEGDTELDEDTVVTFNGSMSSDNVGIVDFIWTIEGSKLSGEEVSHTFEDPGTYTVKLNVTDSAGNYNETSMEVTVKDVTDPTADAGSNTTVSINENFTLDGSGSTDNVGIESYEWTINGEEYQGMTVTDSFDKLGNYTAELTVTDKAGNSDTDTITIEVVDETPPTADAGPDKIVGVDEEITLDASGSSDNVEIESYVWTIDDEELGPAHSEGSE
ncbi:MAG: PKD domain-containing protein, partial [Thermoplasmata archaeon]